MSYQVLARKYRPQTFQDLVGQAHVATTLSNALKNQKVAHAYLFSGPRGVGKTTPPASWPRRSLRQRDHDTPCNACDSCLRIAQGRKWWMCSKLMRLPIAGSRRSASCVKMCGTRRREAVQGLHCG